MNVSANVSTSASVTAPILEVFASIQGEGLYAGEPQVFLRLGGCPFRCRYCDTPHSWLVPDERSTPLDAACEIRLAEGENLRTLSVTGGEPLLWVDFLADLRNLIGERRVHLETAGGHPEELERALDLVDHVSLDLKCAADLADPVATSWDARPRSGSEAWEEARERCLELVRDRDACGKIVVADAARVGDYRKLLEEVECLAGDLPLFLMPATPRNGLAAVGAEALDPLVERGMELGLDLRVLPQLHPVLGVR